MANREEAKSAKAKAEELIKIAEYHKAKTVASIDQNWDPDLKGISEIIAMIDIYIAYEEKEDEKHDLYRVLSVDPCSDKDTIRRRYRKLSLKVHPVKNHYVGAEGAFNINGEAHCILTDNEKRLEYDEERAAAKARKLQEEEARVKAQMSAYYQSYEFQPYWNGTLEAHGSNHSCSGPSQFPPAEKGNQYGFHLWNGNPTLDAQGGNAVHHFCSGPSQFSPAEEEHKSCGFNFWNGNPTPNAQGENGVHISSSGPSHFPPAEAQHQSYGFSNYWNETSTADVQGSNGVHHSTGGTSQAPVAEPEPQAPRTSVWKGQSSNRLRKRKASQKPDTFWTLCDHCKFHYEFDRLHLNGTLLCDNCEKLFLAREIAPPAGF